MCECFTFSGTKCLFGTYIWGIQCTFFWEKFFTASGNKINPFAVLKHLYPRRLLSYPVMSAD